MGPWIGPRLKGKAEPAATSAIATRLRSTEARTVPKSEALKTSLAPV